MYVEQGIKEVNFLIFLIKKFGRFKKWEYLCIAFRKSNCQNKSSLTWWGLKKNKQNGEVW